MLAAADCKIYSNFKNFENETKSCLDRSDDTFIFKQDDMEQVLPRGRRHDLVEKMKIHVRNRSNVWIRVPGRTIVDQQPILMSFSKLDWIHRQGPSAPKHKKRICWDLQLFPKRKDMDDKEVVYFLACEKSIELCEDIPQHVGAAACLLASSGSGNMIKAALRSRVKVAAFCRNDAQFDIVRTNCEMVRWRIHG